MSLIEAQAANNPIVSTRVDGISDIVVENGTALLADIADSEAFCNHLLQVVKDDDLRTRLGANSRNYVVERFSYRRLMSDMSSLYLELLEKKNKR